MRRPLPPSRRSSSPSRPRPARGGWRDALSVFGLAVLALSGAILLAGCGGGGPDSASEEGAAEGARQFLSVGTAPPGGAFFVVGGALAEVLEQRGAGGSWTVTAEATKGSQENIRRLARGELDLALSNSAITYFAVRGTEGWEKSYGVQAVMTLAPNVALFVAPESEGITSLVDMTGKRVVMGPAGAGFEYFLRPILSAHGLSYDDLDVLNNTQSRAVDMLSDASASAAFLGGAVPTASITQAASSMDLTFVPFDAGARESLISQYLFFRPAVIPAGTYRGQDEDFEGLDVGSMHLITRSDADPDLIYEVTRALYENREEVIARHPAGRSIREENVVRDTGTPFHPGAIRYYQEIGIWPEGE